ncbi:MAG: hypothetical protein Q7S73_00515 [bacterium]|nr:hypothetical protein [bacterium]
MYKVTDINPLNKNSFGERPLAESSSNKFSRKLMQWSGWILSIVLAAALVKLLLLSTLLNRKENFPTVDETKFQAVFLVNGQSYFGHLKEDSKEYVTLSEIYYIKTDQLPQTAKSAPQPQLSLVKLGSEIHGPEDTMYIPKIQIAFWENLKVDSSVTKLIKEQGGK